MDPEGAENAGSAQQAGSSQQTDPIHHHRRSTDLSFKHHGPPGQRHRADMLGHSGGRRVGFEPWIGPGRSRPQLGRKGKVHIHPQPDPTART
jgi:hypothetical protein